QKQFMVASALLSDGTVQNVTAPPTAWLSSHPDVADILSTGSSQTNGRLEAGKVGTTTLSATVQLVGGGTLVGTATVNVHCTVRAPSPGQAEDSACPGGATV